MLDASQSLSFILGLCQTIQEDIIYDQIFVLEDMCRHPILVLKKVSSLKAEILEGNYIIPMPCTFRIIDII